MKNSLLILLLMLGFVNIIYSQDPLVCTEQVNGNNFSWTHASGAYSDGTVLTEDLSQPAANGGFYFDIYRLDNSFNMMINGVSLAQQEIQFEQITPTSQNIRFQDGDIWNVAPVPNIWTLRGDLQAPKEPILRVVINSTGQVSMFGIKQIGGPLLPLVLFNGNQFNTISWNTNSSNVVQFTQVVKGATVVAGYGYGLNIVECGSFSVTKEGVFNDEDGDGYAQPGETISYTIEVKNEGNVGLANIVVNDPILGGVIAGPVSGDVNNDNILNPSETWVYTASYPVTQVDIDDEGVYNLADVAVENVNGDVLPPVTSVDPTPLAPTDPHYDPTRPDHTFVELISCSTFVFSAPDDMAICLGDAITLTAINPDNVGVSWDLGVVDGVSFRPIIYGCNNLYRYG